MERPLPASQLHRPRDDPHAARSRPGRRPAWGAVAGYRRAGGRRQDADGRRVRLPTPRSVPRRPLVRADTETSLVSGYRELAEVLNLPEKDESDSNKVAAAVRRWLGREPGYLLILDNADDPALVKPYLPPDPKGHVLLTSRAHNFDRLNIRRPIELPVLEPDEALAFLRKCTDREGPLDPAEQDAARTLAGELGYLPLALVQAAAYMKEHAEAFSVYLAAYRALRLKLLDAMGPVAGEYPETVRTTWKRSFDAVAESSPGSIACSTSAPSSLPTPSPMS